MARARDIANIINSGTFITPASASATYLPLTGGSVSGNLSINGLLTNSAKPMFYATANTGTSANNIVKFDNAILNVGNYFNTSNYRFVAPVSGVYFFHAQANPSGGAPNVGFVFRKNGTTITATNSYSTTNDDQTTTICTVYLNQSEYVEVYTFVGVDANPWCNFGGYLVG
jgi:hypothetical protein